MRRLVGAVEMQEIEGEEDEPVRFARECVVQRATVLERPAASWTITSPSISAERQASAGASIGDARVAVRPIMAAAHVALRPAAADRQQGAEAVVLNLV